MPVSAPRGDANHSAGLAIDELVSWPPLLAATVLAVNDHILKVEFASWWTGKLSDIAGLFYFPLFLTASGRLLFALARWIAGPRAGFAVPPLRRAHLVVAVALTGLVFTAINVWAPAMRGWDAALSLFVPSRGTADVSDLIALPSLGLSYLWGRRFVRG